VYRAEVPNEDTPRIYRLEAVPAEEIQDLIWAAYQILSEHQPPIQPPGSTRIPTEEPSVSVRDFIRGLGLEAFRRRWLRQTPTTDSLKSASNGYWVAPTIKMKKLPGLLKSPTLGWGSFVDALVDKEYQTNFGDTTALSAPSLQRSTH